MEKEEAEKDEKDEEEKQKQKTKEKEEKEKEEKQKQKQNENENEKEKEKEREEKQICTCTLYFERERKREVKELLSQEWDVDHVEFDLSSSSPFSLLLPIPLLLFYSSHCLGGEREERGEGERGEIQKEREEEREEREERKEREEEKEEREEREEREEKEREWPCQKGKHEKLIAHICLDYLYDPLTLRALASLSSSSSSPSSSSPSSSSSSSLSPPQEKLTKTFYKKVVDLTFVIVEREERRKGIGLKALREAEKFAKKMHKMKYSVLTCKEELVSFYEAAGYSFLRDACDVDHQDNPLSWMFKSL